ncbi:unnamed protein product [Rotaria sp. Silwood1]|nr:unnamed protein product [Rotaria sp. Silwood1]
MALLKSIGTTILRLTYPILKSTNKLRNEQNSIKKESNANENLRVCILSSLDKSNPSTNQIIMTNHPNLFNINGGKGQFGLLGTINNNKHIYK